MQTYTSSWVVPMSRPPIVNGRVAVEQGRIAWVGQAGDPGEPAGPVGDLGPGVLLPGLVNAHCHLELSHLKDRVPGDAGFVEWVRNLVAVRGADPSEAIRARIAEAIDSVVNTGTVGIGDVSNSLAHLDLLGESDLDVVVFHELLAWDPAKAEAVLEAAEAHERGLALPPGVTVRLAAHAPHSVSAPLLRALVARGGPAAIHLAESREESRFLATGNGAWASFLRERVGEIPFAAPGMSPVAYADSLGVLHPRLVAAHCVQVDADDRALLARRGVHVAVCPRSNRALGVGIPPVPDLLAAGVNLCLGTDSLASAGTLDLMDDVRALHEEFPALEPRTLIELATQGGARALGLHDLGSLEVGKRAALVHAAAAVHPDEPFEFLVSGEARLRPVPREGASS